MENNTVPANPYSPHHYSRWEIEPWDFILANKLDFMRGNIIKYLMRYDAKNGYEDLVKARVYLDKLISSTDPENGAYKAISSVSQMWSVSTANITEMDNEILARNAFNPDTCAGDHLIIRSDAGFFIQVDDLKESGHVFPDGLSDAFSSLYNTALKAGMAWLALDRDADPASGFKTFEW